MKTEQKKCLGEFLRYALMNVSGMIGLSCYILADTFFVATGLGADGLAALNLAIPVYSLVHGTGLMLGMGGATRYAIFRGQGADSNGNRVFFVTLCLSVCFMAAYTASGLFLSEKIASFLGADEAVFSMTETYLKVILLFAPAFLLNDILLCFVRNDGNPRLSMAAMLTGSMSNILLDYIFIFPMNMGIFGAVLATGMAPLISMAVMSSYFIRKKNHFRPERGEWKAAMPGSIFSLGFPSLVTEVSSGLVIVVFNIIILRLQGNTGVAAYGVIANISLVVIAVYTGVAQGMQPILSRSYGRGRMDESRYTFFFGICSVAILTAVIYPLISVFAAQIAAVFNSENNRQLGELAVSGMRIYFTAIPFAGFNIILSIYFTSMERALPAQIISLLRGFVLIVPLTVLLSLTMGITGVWMSFPAAEAIVSLTGLAFLSGKRNRKTK